jgi:hypothetical protein
MQQATQKVLRLVEGVTLFGFKAHAIVFSFGGCGGSVGVNSFVKR